MRHGLIISAVLHVSVLLLAVLGVLPGPKPLDMPVQAIPIDIVEVGEITNTRVAERQPDPKPAPAPARPAAPPPPPPSAAAPPPPPPPRTAPEPPKLAEAPPPPRPPEPPKAPDPEPMPVKAPEPKPAPPPERKPEAPKPEPPKPEPPKQVAEKPPEPKKPEPRPEKKPEPQKPEPKKDQPDFSQLLKDLTKKPDQPRPPAPPQPQQAAEAPAPASDAPRLSDRLTVGEKDALIAQISRCWYVDPGKPGIADIAVEIRLTIGRDRTIQDARVVDQARMVSDRVYRSVAESALRALKKEECRQLDLPPDKYDSWRDAVFVFSPRDVL